MASLGKIEEFNPSQTNIVRYLERLEQYFEANDVPADSETSNKRRAILISAIGARTYDVLSDLCSPDSPASKTFNELASTLKSHFAPKKLVIAERYRFHNCIQKDGESVSEFVANLKRLASTCSFGTYLNEALRDRFVCGLRSANIKKKLLAEDYTFDNALKVALGIEAADKDVADISHSGTHLVNKVGGNPSRFKKSKSLKGDQHNLSKKQGKDTQCVSCGKTGHARSTCKYRNFTCYTCGKAGHIAKACRSKNAQLNNVRNVPDNENLGDPFSTSIFKLSKTNAHGIEIPVEINDTHLLMEIDTGAGISIISKETFDKNFNNVTLKPSSTRLHTYTGDQIKVCGQFDAKVNYNYQSVTLPLIVVEGSGPSLFGRDWLAKIKVDWKRIFNVSVSSDFDLPSDTTQRLHATIQSHSEVFKQGLGTIKGIKARLDVKDGIQPKFCKARPVPYALQSAVEEEYNRLEREGIIEKVDFSEWATPMVHIPKSDNTTRSCGDYAVTVNPQLQVPHYPIPLPEDVFRKLRGGKLFTKLDLKNAYQQLLLEDESQQYVTINTHRGLYRYKRLPFGIAASPAIFQRSIDVILQGIDNVAAIQDDILVTGKDDADHIRNLEATLHRLEEYGVRLKLEKCKFMQKSVTYMGCIISSSGIKPTEEKVEAVKKAPQPENVTQLRSFLGMVNYHGKFIKNLSSILHPLNQLLQKGREFSWSPECEKAFQLAKNSLSSLNVLVHYNPELPVVLECDASPYGIGAVISHRFPDNVERPIAYASRSLNAAEKSYSQIEKEGLAIVFGLSKFYMYLYGQKFTLYTDHKPLLKIFAPNSATSTLAAARLQRWSLLLSSYHYEIRYKSSTDIANADALSRLPLQYQKDTSVEEHIFNITDLRLNCHPVSAKEIAKETARDRVLSKVLTLTQNGWNQACDDPELKPYYVRRNEISIEQGCLLWGLRVIIPPKFQTKVVNVLHEAHPGIVRMKSMSRSYVWWPKLDSAIEETVKACRQCASIRASPLVAPLTPWIWPSKPWKRVHVDFASHEGNHYLVVVDAHSKWPEVIGPMKITSAEATINALRCIFGRYGLPEQVVSDNGPPFQSAEYDDFLRQNGIKRVLVSPYHPASNGQAERFVQTFKNFLKTANSQSSFLQRIQCFLLNYRSTPHTTTGCSPAKLFLQREVRTRLSLVKPDTASVVLENQSRMKSYHDQYAKFREFEVGQSVLARDYRSKTKWQLGTISERNGPHSYTVALPDGRIWKRHVDQLLKDSPSKVQQAEPIPSNLGNQREPQDLSVPSTSSIPSTPSPPTESTPSPPTVPQERTQNHPSEVTQDASITIESPAIKLRRSSRTIKQPKRLIDEIANT